MDTASAFRLLHTGAPELDELLRLHGVGRGALLSLDMEFPKAPDSFLMALAQSTIEGGGRVAYIFAPPLEWVDRSDPADLDLCLGRRVFGPVAHLAHAFGLSPHLNAQNPGDPTKAFRYLTALTLGDLGSVVEDLLGSPSDAPELILIAGLEQLFQALPLFGNPPGGPVEDEFALVVEANSRLRAWLETYSHRCRDTGTTMLLCLTESAYQTSYTTMFRLRLGHLLSANTTATLLVLNGEDPGDANQVDPDRDLSAPRHVEVCLYRAGALLGKADVAVATVVNDVESAVDGPFLPHG